MKGQQYFEDRPWLCEVIASLCLTVCVCAFLSLSTIALNRYCYICHVKVYQMCFGRRRNIIWCIACWIGGFAVDLSKTIGWGDRYFDQKSMQCIWNRKVSESYTMFLGFGVMAVPLILMVVAYILIFYRVYRSRLQLLKFRSPSGSAPSAARGKVSKQEITKIVRQCRSVFLITTAFIVCWAPYICVILIDIEDQLPLWVHLWVTFLAHLHSVLNTPIYWLSSGTLRKAFYGVFSQLGWRKETT